MSRRRLVPGDASQTRDRLSITGHHAVRTISQRIGGPLAPPPPFALPTTTTDNCTRQPSTQHLQRAWIGACQTRSGCRGLQDGPIARPTLSFVPRPPSPLFLFFFLWRPSPNPLLRRCGEPLLVSPPWQSKRPNLAAPRGAPAMTKHPAG